MSHMAKEAEPSCFNDTFGNATSHSQASPSDKSFLTRQTGGQPVVSLTEALVTCLVYRSEGFFGEIMSKASSR